MTTFKIVNLDNATIAQFTDRNQAVLFAQKAVSAREYLWLALTDDVEVMTIFTILK